MYGQSKYERWEKRGERLVPVEVTKQWVTREDRDGKTHRKFIAVRVTELRRAPNLQQAPEAWASCPELSFEEERAGLIAQGLVTPPAYMTAPFLPIGDATLTWSQASQELEPLPDSHDWWLRRQWAEARGFADVES